MFEVEIGGRRVSAEVSFLTGQIYEAEFKGDMIKDYFGKETIRLPESDEPDEQDGDGAALVSVDFTQTNWVAATKVLWAAVKTADPRTPGFALWARGASGANMWEVADRLTYEIVDCFFRPGAAKADEDGQQAQA